MSYGETSDPKTDCPASTFPILLNYSLDNGKVLQSCFNKNEKSIFIKTQSSLDSTLDMEIPRILLDKLDLNCQDVGFNVIVNGVEIRVQDFSDQKFRNLRIPINQGESNVIIIGAESIVEKIHLGNFLECNKKIISLFSPLKQQKYLSDQKYYSCKQGLELIFKNNNSPACVKPETVEKLLDRGWARS